ncbi:MAG TPA: hypothetical protein VKA60_21240 [Blastocatellia bacterium]|nr:hypothetical protein [Blastocatellia bacterium]
MNRKALEYAGRMARRIVAFFLLLGLLDASLPPLGVVSAASRDKKWRKDLKVLRKSLPNTHPNLFFKLSPDEFNQAVDDLDSAIPSLQDHEIIVRMTRIVAMAGDSHTRLDWEQTATTFRTFPLRLWWFSDGLYVIATTADYRRALGARLVQVGDATLEQAFAAVSSLIPHENEQWLKARSPDYLVVPEILNALKVVPDMERGHFVFEEVGGSQFAMDFAPLARDASVAWLQWPDPSVVPTPLYRKQPGDYYWFEYLADSQTFYLKYNQCAEMNALPVAMFAQQVTAFVNSHAVARFVIDLRDNPGGSTEILYRIIAVLTDRPDLKRRGHFFVIVGRRTFSSAVLNAVVIKGGSEALFFGEPTGGKPNSYGETQTIALPRTGLAATCSTRFFNVVEGDPHSFNPDINVEISPTDYLSGRDAVLEEILKYGGQAGLSPQGLSARHSSSSR